MSFKIHFGTIIECIGAALIAALVNTSMSWFGYILLILGSMLSFWGYMDVERKIDTLYGHDEALLEFLTKHFPPKGNKNDSKEG